MKHTNVKLKPQATFYFTQSVIFGEKPLKRFIEKYNVGINIDPENPNIDSALKDLKNLDEIYQNIEDVNLKYANLNTVSQQYLSLL